MSKPIVSLPGKHIKDSVTGGVIALAVYTALQFPIALLVYKEVLSENALYPAVCISAALASFSGCGYTVLRGGKGKPLGVASVIAVFLLLTIMTGSGLAGRIELGDGAVGVGLSMAAGGLAAALVGEVSGGSKRNRYSTNARRKK